MSFFDQRLKAAMNDPEFAAGYDEAETEIQRAISAELERNMVVITSVSGSGFAGAFYVSSDIPFFQIGEPSGVPSTSGRPSTETTIIVAA